MNGAPGFKDKVKLVFVSYGSKELAGNNNGPARNNGNPREITEALRDAGVRARVEERSQLRVVERAARCLDARNRDAEGAEIVDDVFGDRREGLSRAQCA